MLNRWTLCSIFCQMGTLILGIFFLISSLTKIARPYDFLYIVYDYQLLPGRMSEWIAFYLPWLELVLSVSLLFNLFRTTGMFICSVLLTVFVVAQSSLLIRKTPTACGCFNSLSETISVSDFLRTLVLLAVSVSVAYLLMKHGDYGNNEGKETIRKLPPGEATSGVPLE